MAEHHEAPRDLARQGDGGRHSRMVRKRRGRVRQESRP
jgi:hypothetical protein